MAARIRNNSWTEDNDLKADLKKYVEQNLQRWEILSFVKRDFEQYAWSLRSLDRRLRFFDIYYIDKNVQLEDVKVAVHKELEGPGKLLGYRPMYQKIRQLNHLNVPRNLVHDIMYDLDPDGLDARCPLMRKKKPKGNFTTKGSNWVHSLDGHDKLMGYQNSTFPLAIYGCIDTASRKLLWLRIWTSNSDPKLIGRWYLDHLYETKIIGSMLRVDKGTETGIMATMHACLRQHHGDMDPINTVIFGPSTANQIERWWRELHERLEKFFKVQLNWLKDQGFYDPHCEEDRMLLAFLLIPVIEKQLHIFKDVWNTHRIRKQKNTVLPDGVPDHIYNFPEEYGLSECGWPVNDEQLQQVAQDGGLLDVETDFLEPEFRDKCEQIIPFPAEVLPEDCQETYLYLKENFIS